MVTQRVTSSPDFRVLLWQRSSVRIRKTEGLCNVEDPESPPHVNSVTSILLESLAFTAHGFG